MPELPEVETIRRDLDAKLRGARVRQVEVRLAKITSPKGREFAKKLRGARIREVKRRAKLLALVLNKGIILIHLKMTGQLVLRHHQQIIFGGHTIVGAHELPNKYTHVIFYFTNGDELYFNDLRQFGYLKLMTSAAAQKILDEYGLEPLSRDFTLEKFAEILKKRRSGKLKSVLMDQSLFAGIGNIYADESCFLARVRPARRAPSLNRKELRALWLAIKSVLKLSIKHRGTSFNTYVDSQGQAGNFVKYLKVYGRGGEPCKVCGTILKRTVLAGRGSVYCPKCQH